MIDFINVPEGLDFESYQKGYMAGFNACMDDFNAAVEEYQKEAIKQAEELGLFNIEVIGGGDANG